MYAEEKVVAMREAAALDGIDLEHSWAYSDSATDIPMLEAVGHPVAVNPDRELARAARGARLDGGAVPPGGVAARPRADAGAAPGRGGWRGGGGDGARGGRLVVAPPGGGGEAR